MSDTSSTRYWAADTAERAAEGALERRKEYRDYLKRTGKADRIQRSISTFYGYSPNGDADAAEITASGEQGEIKNLIVNQYAALVEQGIVLITSEKPAFKAVASNTDSKSLAQAVLGDGLLEYYDRELGVSDVEGGALFRAMLMSKGAVAATWDTTAGSAYGVDPDAGAEVMEGDCRFRALGPYDMFYAPRAAPGRRKWLGIEWPENKWDLIAQYPEKETDILAAEPAKDDEWFSHRNRKTTDDDVTVYELFHASSPSVPGGRLIVFLSPKCVLFDGPLPYDEVPVYELSPKEAVGDSTGHTSSFDLLGLAQLLDMLATIATTNLEAGGVANLWAENANDLNVKQLPGGLNFITSKTKPEVLEGVKPSPEVAAWAALVVNWMQNISGVNAAVRGEPDKGMPAQAMAFLQAAAIQYHSRLQAAFTALREKVRTANLRLLKRYANSKRVALISGKSNTWTRKEFTADDLCDVDRVTVETVNPMMRTLQGRVSIADALRQGPNPIRNEQYLTLINTGRLEPMFEGEQANLLRIRRNRELLQDGIGLPPVAMPLAVPGMPPPMAGALPQFADDGQPHVRPLKTDTHWLDIPEYLSVLATPGARENPAVVKAVTEVIEYQLMLWRQMDPALIMILGGTPAPMAVPMGAPVPGGAANATQPPEGGATASTMPAMAPNGGSAADVKLPGLPKTPTGQQPPMAGVSA